MPSSSIYDEIYLIITFIDSILSIILTSIGLYLFITKRKSIKRLFTLLTNYSLQNTISELNEKLNELHNLSAEDKNIVKRREILCIFHDIKGQIEGNKFLKNEFVEDFDDFREYFDGTKEITNADKRRMASRFREKLKTLNLETYNDLVGKDNE
ncbi:MAG: hypothetical protein AAGU10_08280 [Methanosarcina mazei]